MARFTDNEKREWVVSLDVTTLKRVKQAVDVDLNDMLDNRLIERLIADPVLLCDVLYVVCQQQAEASSVDDESFGRALAGDALDHATRALLEACADFTPFPKHRANIRVLIEKTRMAVDRVCEVIEARLDSGEVEAAIESELAKYGKPSTAAPESSE